MTPDHRRWGSPLSELGPFRRAATGRRYGSWALCATSDCARRPSSGLDQNSWARLSVDRLGRLWRLPHSRTVSTIRTKHEPARTPISRGTDTAPALPQPLDAHALNL